MIANADLHCNPTRGCYQWRTSTHKTAQTWSSAGSARAWVADGLPLTWVPLGRQPGEDHVSRIEAPPDARRARLDTGPRVVTAADRTERALLEAWSLARAEYSRAVLLGGDAVAVLKRHAPALFDALDEWGEARR